MRFTELYQDQIYGVIEGLDRVRFRGTDLMLSNTDGFRLVLNQLGVLLKDFGKWADRTTHGYELLEGLVLNLCPELLELCAPFEIRYYWSADETEFATDVMFRPKAELDALFPALLLHATRVRDCRAVLRYFGRRAEGARLGRVPNQVESDCRRRHEGVRIKHWVNGDSVKMYNKTSLLRAETTINNARNFKAFRRANDDESKPCSWQKMRKGVNDLYRRCEVSRKSNERYLDALSVVQVHTTLHEVAQEACNRTSRNGRPVRGLNPWNQHDFTLLTFLAKGDWALNGLRNKMLCKHLDPHLDKLSPQERKKLSSKASRLIAMRRAHGLVRKIPKENRYVLTQTGQTFANALIIASGIEVKRLTDLAA